MVRRNRYIFQKIDNSFVFYCVLINMLVWYFYHHKVEKECVFILLYIIRARGITSTIAAFRGCDKTSSRFVCFKVFYRYYFLHKNMPSMNLAKSI